MPAIDVIAELAEEAEESMSSWDAYDALFDNGIPGGAIISSVLIVGLCIIGLWIARRMYGDL